MNAWLAFPSVIRDVATAGDRKQVNHLWNNEIVPGTPEGDQFTLRKRMEIFTKEALEQVRAGEIPTDFYAVSQIAQKFRSDDVAHRITCKVLVLDYEGEEFYPGQAQELYDLLDTDKELVHMTAANGAQLHCAPMAPQYRSTAVPQRDRLRLPRRRRPLTAGALHSGLRQPIDLAWMAATVAASSTIERTTREVRWACAAAEHVLQPLTGQ